jgi:CRISPR-associated protein Csd1
LYGRLLAILDAIQDRALNNPNATIIDRYYGSASSAPASVFGTLLHGARHHLAKLRKDEKTRGSYRFFETQLEDVMRPISGFKPTLSLQEQGLFALGFYHQRAANRKPPRATSQADDVETAAADDSEAGSPEA